MQDVLHNWRVQNWNIGESGGQQNVHFFCRLDFKKFIRSIKLRSLDG